MGGKNVYRRLGNHPGIVPCYGISSGELSIQMALMKNGDLRHYLERTPPAKTLQLSWLIHMAQTMEYIHDRPVIVADYRLDNLLLDDEFNIKMTDFGASILMPEDWDLDVPAELGYSRAADLGQFGAAMYEIVTRQKCEFDLCSRRRFSDLAPQGRMKYGLVT
jgi:serine/threonine protein kinase